MIGTWSAIAWLALAWQPQPAPAAASKAPPAERAKRTGAPAPSAAAAQGAASADAVAERSDEYAPVPWSSATGHLQNLDAGGHDLELACGQQLFTARIGSRQQVLLVDPLRGGCTLKIVDSGRSLLLPAAASFDLVIENGTPRQIAQPLIWNLRLASYGNVSSWPTGLTRQWAQTAKASSEYSTASWSGMQATGAPTLTACADSGSAWTTKSQTSAQPEWIELRYPSKVRAIGARLYVTLTPGAVRKIEGKTASGWETLWQGNDPTASCPAVLELKFNEEIDTDTLRIVLDTSKQSYWFELDAVELLGISFK